MESIVDTIGASSCQHVVLSTTSVDECFYGEEGVAASSVAREAVESRDADAKYEDSDGTARQHFRAFPGQH